MKNKFIKSFLTFLNFFCMLLVPIKGGAESGSPRAPQIQNSKVLALIKNSKGTVLLTHGNSAIREVKVGEALFENSIIETKDKSTVLISFCENYNCQLRLGSNSKIKIDELMKTYSSIEKEKSFFSILTGIVSFVVKNKLNPLDIKFRANGITFGIRGTQFVVYSNEDKKTLLAVKEGKVEVENEVTKKSSMITENMAYVALADGSEKILANKELVNSFNWDIENLNIVEPEIDNFDGPNPSLKVKKRSLENQTQDIANVLPAPAKKMAVKEISFSEEKMKIEEDMRCLARSPLNCNLFSEKILMNLGINPKSESPEIMVDKLRLYLLEKDSQLIKAKKKIKD